LRELLIDHLDGAEVALRAPSALKGMAAHAAAARYTLTMALIGRGWLRQMGSQARPTHTVITERGRDALAELLADYADALARAADFRDRLDASVPRKYVRPGMDIAAR
jgi:hypothetical protein